MRLTRRNIPEHGLALSLLRVALCQHVGPAHADPVQPRDKRHRGFRAPEPARRASWLRRTHQDPQGPPKPDPNPKGSDLVSLVEALTWKA